MNKCISTARTHTVCKQRLVSYSSTIQGSISLLHVYTNLGRVLGLVTADFELVKYLLHLRVRVTFVTRFGSLFGNWGWGRSRIISGRSYSSNCLFLLFRFI